MAYQIDFTESIWSGRKFRKLLLRLLLLALLAGTAWSVNTVYTIRKEPTLNMRLSEYEVVARPIEEMNAAWDVAAKEYGSLVRYYRLIWAANPTNFLMAMSAPDALRLGRGFRPRRWTLTTGGDCRLEYRFEFGMGDKAVQAKGLEEDVVRAVTSVVQVVGGKVDVRGVQHENLLNVDGFDVEVRFALPDVKAFPAKEKTIAECVSEIDAMRKKVHESRFAEKNDEKGVAPTAQGIMMAYLPLGRDKPDFPAMTNVLDVAGWLARADRFIEKHKIPVDITERKRLKERWNAVGDARNPWPLPWHRFRVLDNEELVERIKVLSSVSDGVKRFKVFLEKRQEDNKRKLEPFVKAYDHADVGNKDLVESDLRMRVAAAAGIAQAFVEKESDANAAVSATLTREDENFAFRWLRWSLSLGGGAGRDGERARTQSAPAAEGPVTLAQLTDCVRRALTLGPGYVLDKVNVEFDANGNVVGARLEGLFPTKTSEPIKEERK